MQSTTTRAVTAHSMLSACTNRQTAATRQKRDDITGRIRHHLRVASSALLLVAAPLGAEAGTAEFGYYSFPAAQAAVSGSYLQPRGDGYYDEISHQDIAYDVNLMTILCGSNHVRFANINFPNDRGVH